jgi:TolB-like protein
VAAEKSIAVLPFEYLCNDKANAYFARASETRFLRAYRKSSI